MKKFVASLLAAAALVAPAVHAADLAYLPNKDNGLIVLTDARGACQTGLGMYTTSAAGQVYVRRLLHHQ